MKRQVSSPRKVCCRPNLRHWANSAKLAKKTNESRITTKYNTLINITKIHKRGSYSAALKEKVSLEALKGKKTLRQIASENSISPELVRQ